MADRLVVDYLPDSVVKPAGKRKLGSDMGSDDRGNFGIRDRKTPGEVRGKMQDRMQEAEDISDAVPRRGYKSGGRVGSDQRPFADYSSKNPYSSAATRK